MSYEVSMLTTIDNPYSPFTQYDAWYALDRQLGHYTPEYLARIAKTSSALSDEQNEAIVDAAINEIVALNPLGIYRKVRENDYMLSNEGKSE